MRKVIVSEFVTLDGVMESPEKWQFPYYSDDMAKVIQAQILDEYRLMVHPVVLGSGKRLFRDGSDTLQLKLLDTKTFRKGVVLLCYQKA